MSDQRLPSHGSQSVTRQLMALLEQREARGIATYGRSLETFNGRDATRDLVEELIDGAQYALQWQLERAELFTLLREVKQERDAARAEVARLRLIVGFIADLKAQKEHAEYGWSGKESDRHWGDLFDALDADRAATGATNAAT